MKKLILCSVVTSLIFSTMLSTQVSAVTTASPTNYCNYSIEDATNTQRILAGIIEDNDYYLSKYDLNRSGSLSIDDATLIQKDCAGLVNLTNSYNGEGNNIAKSAISYYESSCCSDKFIYNEESVFSDTNTEGVCHLRDAEGNAYIDNTSFVIMSILGITYDKSPYASNKNANAVWTPSDLLYSIGIGNLVKYAGVFDEINNYINQYGYSDEIGKMLANYIKNNYEVVYDAMGNEAFTTSDLRPGDIMILNDEGIKMAVVADETSGYFIVKDGNPAILYKDCMENKDLIYCICRIS